MSKKKSDRKPSQDRGGQGQPSQQKKSSLLPLYIIGGILVAGVLVSGMISKFKRGDKMWGEKCTQTSECAEGICYPDDDDIMRCTPLCDKDKKCPIGYRCTSKVTAKRRSMGMVSICVEK